MAETKTTAPKNFLEEVMAYVKCDDKGRIQKILNSAKKVWEKQVQLKERSIEDLNRAHGSDLTDDQDYLSEAKEALAEAFLRIDPTVVGKDNVTNYVEDIYQQQIADAQAAVDSIEDEMADKKEAVEDEISDLKTEIKMYKSYIKRINN